MTVGLHEQFLSSRTQQFGGVCCFICGLRIPEGSAQRTREHVFPKWLLKELDLCDAAATLIDGRRLAYRDLV